MSLADKLNYSLKAKEDMQKSLISKGAPCTAETPLGDYASLIDSISGESDLHNIITDGLVFILPIRSYSSEYNGKITDPNNSFQIPLGNNPRTFEAKFNCKQAGYLFNFGQYTLRQSFSISNDRIVCYSNDFRFKNVPAFNEDVYLSVVYDGSKFLVYWNGILDEEISTPALNTVSNGSFYLACWNGWGEYFLGTIYYTRIYNRILSASEIYYNYLVSGGKVQ